MRPDVSEPSLERGEAPSPQDSGDGSNAVVRWRQSHMVPGRCCVEKLMDGTRWMARSSLRAASLCDAHFMAEPGITRVGLQDDMYAVAQPAKLKTMLEHLQSALQVCGHRLRIHKCKLWFPGWDDTPVDGVPQEAVALLQLIPRERGAWCCWRRLRKVTGAWL